MLSGTFKTFIILSKKVYEIIISIIVRPQVISEDITIPFLIVLLSLFPNAIEIKVLLPKDNPIIMDVRNVIKVYDEPTAAKAVLPMNLPTTHVSAKL